MPTQIYKSVEWMQSGKGVDEVLQKFIKKLHYGIDVKIQRKLFVAMVVN